jgi:hypothetical protein
MIWSLGIIMRALTSRDDREILYCFKMLKTTHAGTGFMHESFERDHPKKFTRSWFAWANTLFGELALEVHSERPSYYPKWFSIATPRMLTKVDHRRLSVPLARWPWQLDHKLLRSVPCLVV